MMAQEKKLGMARWLKITIAVLVLGLLSAICLIVAGGKFVMDSTQKAMDPKYVSKVAESIATFEEPLPEGFTRVMAVDLMGVSEVAFANRSEGLNLMFMKMQKNPKQTQAEVLVDNYVKAGTPPGALGTAGGGALNSPMVIQSKGRIVVGGEEMPYAIGERRMNGIKICQMVGCVIPARTGQPILVLGQSAQVDAYDMDLTKTFLKCVKAF